MATRSSERERVDLSIINQNLKERKKVNKGAKSFTLRNVLFWVLPFKKIHSTNENPKYQQ